MKTPPPAGRAKHKLTNTTVKIDGREVKLVFGVDGLRLREKHAREEMVIDYTRLARMVRAGKAVFRDPLAIEMDVAANNLQLFAVMVEDRADEKLAVQEIEEHLKKTLRLVRARLELMQQNRS